MHVKDLDLFVTVQLLDDAPAVLSLGKLFEDQRYSYKWKGGQTPNLVRHGRTHVANRTTRCLLLSFLVY